MKLIDMWKNRRKTYTTIDCVFIIVMVFCIFVFGIALYSFCKSVFCEKTDLQLLFSKKIADLNLSRMQKMKIDELVTIQLQIQELQTKARQSDLLTFIYQFLSGTLIAIAGYLIKTTASRAEKVETTLKNQEEKVTNVETRSKEQENKLKEVETRSEEQENKLKEVETRSEEQENKLKEVETRSEEQEDKLKAVEARSEEQENKLKNVETNGAKLGSMQSITAIFSQVSYMILHYITSVSNNTGNPNGITPLINDSIQRLTDMVEQIKSRNSNRDQDCLREIIEQIQQLGEIFAYERTCAIEDEQRAVIISWKKKINIIRSNIVGELSKIGAEA